jgi:hypothetical protein
MSLVLKVKEAGVAKDGDTSVIDFYYPYFFQSGASSEVRDLFMKSPELKDNFGERLLQILPARRREEELATRR